MILLETPNRIIGDALRARLALANDPNARPEPLDITFAEFDDVMYHLTSSADEPHLVTVSLALKCFATLQAHGAAAVIAARFGAMAQAAPEAGHDLTLVVDTRAFPADAAAREAQVDAVASVKRHVFSGPLEQVFDAVAKGAEGGDTVAVQYRPNETMWIVPQKEQVVVVFSVEFRDASDIPIAKVFLQEFAEARRQAGLGAAPPVSWVTMMVTALAPPFFFLIIVLGRLGFFALFFFIGFVYSYFFSPGLQPRVAAYFFFLFLFFFFFD
jgi:actin related protein 2/3 complex subunit 2